MQWVTFSVLSVSRFIRIEWVAGRGVDPGMTVWQKLAFATASPRSPCRGAALAWLGDAWGGAAGQLNSCFSDLGYFGSRCVIMLFFSTSTLLIYSCSLKTYFKVFSSNYLINWIIGRILYYKNNLPQKETVVTIWTNEATYLYWHVPFSKHKLTLSLPRRVLLDRAYTDYDNIFHGLDPEMLDLPLPPSPPPPPPPLPPPTTTSRSPATNKFASTSETNTSDRSSSSPSSPSSTDLSQILLNIKSCRWRHFRPRTLPLHELDNAHPLFRKLSRGLKRPLSASAAGGQPYGSQRPVRVVPAPTPVAGKWIGCLQTH